MEGGIQEGEEILKRRRERREGEVNKGEWGSLYTC